MKTQFPGSELTAAEREEWRDLLARPSAPTDDSRTVRLLVVRAGNEWYGLPPHCVVHCEPLGPVHSVPNRPPALAGVVNVRGTVSLCFSLAGVLHAAPAPEASRPMLVALVHDSWRVACRVEEVAGIIPLAGSSSGPPPATLSHRASALVTDILAWDDRPVARLDAAALFEALHAIAR